MGHRVIIFAVTVLILGLLACGSEATPSPVATVHLGSESLREESQPVPGTPTPVIRKREGPYGIVEYIVIYPASADGSVSEKSGPIHSDYRDALMEAFPPPTLRPGSPSIYEQMAARFNDAGFTDYGIYYCRGVSLETVSPPPELRAFHEASIAHSRTNSEASWDTEKKAYRQFLIAVESANADIYPNAPRGWIYNAWSEDGPCFWPGVWGVVKWESDQVKLRIWYGE